MNRPVRSLPRLSSFVRVASLTTLLACATAASAQEAQPPRRAFDTAIGVAYSSGPEYLGSDHRSSGVRPYFATYYGRWRISSGGAGQVLGFGTNEQGSGATAQFYRDNGWSASAGLRYDRGRKRSDSRYLTGLDDVRNTLRAKLSVGRDMAGPWSLSSTLSLDLLGRGGGTELSLDANRRERLGPMTEWRSVVGVGFGDGTLMRTQFGVSPAEALRTTLPVHQPGTGAKDLHASTTILHGLTRNWIVHATASAGHLLGGASSSPLTHQGYWWGVSVGLGYRWNAQWAD